jgi:hypothetical protein
MRSFWIIHMGPKSNDKCLHNTHTEESHVNLEREIRGVQSQARVQSQAKVHPQSPEAGGTKEGFSPRVIRASIALLTDHLT